MTRAEIKSINGDDAYNETDVIETISMNDFLNELESDLNGFISDLENMRLENFNAYEVIKELKEIVLRLY